jgi:multiple sugar transport system permease protein
MMLVVLSVSMVPAMSIVVPLYTILRSVNLTDTYGGLIIPYVTFSLPIAILVLSVFFQKIPKDLENAARIDGCSRLQALYRVIVPLSAPGLSTAGILVFIGNWNEFLIALTMTSRQLMRTIPVGIALYPGEHYFPWGTIAAATTIAVLPMVVAVLVGQTQIVKGLTAGALKS